MASRTLTFVLSLISVARAAYNESFARNQAMCLAGASYSLTPQACLTASAIPDAKVTKIVSVDCSNANYTGQCAGYVGYSLQSQAVFVAFRGTHGSIQLIVEVGQTAFTATRASPVGGSVSSYFLEVFNKVWTSGLRDELTALAQQYPTFKVWVTGHSLGGALASLAAGSIAKQGIYPSANILLYTFGQPRTGNVAYAQAIEQLVPEAYRVVHSHDIVPHVPPQGFEGYRHHKTEVWYNNNAMTDGATYKICATDTVFDCSNTNVFNLSTDDHLHYFNVRLSGLCPNPVPSAP